jgi:hypothetical protein
VEVVFDINFPPGFVPGETVPSGGRLLPLIDALAQELLRRGRMDQADIEKFLLRGHRENRTLLATSEKFLEVQNEVGG